MNLPGFFFLRDPLGLPGFLLITGLVGGSSESKPLSDPSVNKYAIHSIKTSVKYFATGLIHILPLYK